MKKQLSRGVTLIEIIIVVTIIVVLAVIALVYLRSQAFKGQDGRRKADIRRIQTAAEEYERDHNCYPLPSLMSCNPGTGLTPYINKIPCDPVNGGSYMYIIQDSVCPTWYKIYSKLGNSQDASIINNIGPNSAFNYVAGSANAPTDTSASPATNSPSSTPVPSGFSGPNSGFYGCSGGVCVPIAWDVTRPGPACDPNYQNNTCYGQCGTAQNECTPWH